MTRLLAWLRSPEAIVLCAVAGIAAGVWIFALIAGEVKGGDTQSFDRSILLSMRHTGDLSPKGSREFQEAVRDVTSLGGVVILTIVTGATAVFLAFDGK